MKLYLSSYGLANKPNLFRHLIGPNKRIAVVLNAQDLAPLHERHQKLEKELEAMSRLGLKPEELDLRHYFGKSAILAKRLEEFGAVWVRGGNVFILRRAMAQSGFDRATKFLVNSNQLSYGGFSAGSCVVGPSLKGIELVDNAFEVPAGYNKPAVWEGLGWIDFAIAPHYRSNHRESAAIEGLISYYERNEVPFRALHDGEVIIVEDNKVRLVG